MVALITSEVGGSIGSFQFAVMEPTIVKSVEEGKTFPANMNVGIEVLSGWTLGEAGNWLP
jgi:hypothetical protein